jgi:hypothetical protein
VMDAPCGWLTRLPLSLFRCPVSFRCTLAVFAHAVAPAAVSSYPSSSAVPIVSWGAALESDRRGSDSPTCVLERGRQGAGRREGNGPGLGMRRMTQQDANEDGCTKMTVLLLLSAKVGRAKSSKTGVAWRYTHTYSWNIWAG